MHLAMVAGGTCAAFKPSPLTRTIRLPVGAIEKRGPNTAGNTNADTRVVQDLLDTIPGEQGGQAGLGKGGQGLVVDGLCGPLTRAAIVAFQKKQFGSPNPDGIVDPDGRSINRMNVLAFPEVDAILLDKGRAAVAVAARFIANAQARLVFVEMALRNRPGMLFNLAGHLALANKHFHFDRSTGALRDFDFVRSTMVSMHTVVAHVPAGPNGEPAFGFIDVMPTDNNQVKVPFAYTTAGGWRFGRGEGTRNGTTESEGMIYLTRQILTLREEAIVYGIIHELGHFVGGRRGDIDHIAERASFPDAKYPKLSCFEAITNADCYAQYIFEANTGRQFNRKTDLA